MKKFTIFFSIILLLVLTLSWCNEKKETESINITNTWANSVISSTWAENTWSTEENKKDLEEVNSEIEQVINEIEKSWSETGATSSWKVMKIDKTYKSPGWDDKVSFSIKLNWNKIESVAVTPVEWSEKSREEMAEFGKSINSVVSWKTIEEAKNISVVGWASLTTNAFKEALKNI